MCCFDVKGKGRGGKLYDDAAAGFGSDAERGFGTALAFLGPCRSAIMLAARASFFLLFWVLRSGQNGNGGQVGTASMGFAFPPELWLFFSPVGRHCGRGS